MKKLLILLVLLVSFSACKKEKDVEPETLSARVAGTYELKSFRYKDKDNNVNIDKMPATQNGRTASGTVVLRENGDDQVDMKLTLKVTGNDDASIDIDGMEVQEAGKALGLFIDGTRVADADGSSIIFNISETDQSGQRVEFAFTAQR